ncbi:Electron transport complex subunit RnfE [compost metagenome]
MNKHAPWFAPLGLALLLGASQTLVQALSLVLATVAVLLMYSLIMAPLRRHLPPGMREAACLLLSAAIVSCLDLGLRAWALEVQQGLGLYLPLISLNCLFLERTRIEQAGTSLPPLGAIAGYGVLALILGLCRELLASGGLSSGWSLVRETSGLHLATLAPGSFILLGLLIAAYRALRSPTSAPDSRKETLAP